MPVYRVRTIWLVSTIAVVALFQPLEARAQGCSSCNRSQTAATYYQPTTAYQMSGVATPYYSGGLQPAVQPIQVQPLYQQMAVSRPIPRTSYRSQWIPNRVTFYTPTMGVNPTTGAPLVTYRACQTQRQVLQRVPTCGWFSRPTTCCAPTACVPTTGCS